MTTDQTPSTTTPHEQLIERDLRRNVAAIVGWELLWGLGLPFALYWTLVPAYLQQLQASKTLIGLVGSFPTLFAPLAIVSSYWIRADRRMKVTRRTYVFAILPWLVYSVSALSWGQKWPLALHRAMMVFSAAAFMGGFRAMVATFFEVLTDNVPVKRRGKLFGLRSGALGGAGLASGYAAVRVLRHWPAPMNFQVSFLIGLALFLLSCSTLWFIRDHVNPAHTDLNETSRPPLWGWLKDSVSLVWHEPNYRQFLFFQGVLNAACLGASFVVAAAGDVLGATPEQQGVFGVVYVGGMAATGWLVGWVADRYGYRLTGFLIAALLASAYLTCFASRTLTLWFVAYGCMAVSNMAWNSILCNMGAEICPDVKPGHLMALGHSSVLLGVVPAMAACGRLVDYLGSYDAVFAVLLTLALVAALGFALLVREPRTGRLYMIKPLRHP